MEENTQNNTPEEENKPEGEMVQVPKDKLDAVLAEMEQIKKDNAMLKEVADKGRVARYMAANKGEAEPLRLGIRQYNGKIVLGWAKVKDEVYKEPNTGIWRENQVIKLVYHDNTADEVPYLDFSRRYEKVECKVLKSTTDDQTGNKTFDIEVVQDGPFRGEQFKVDSPFVN